MTNLIKVTIKDGFTQVTLEHWGNVQEVSRVLKFSRSWQCGFNSTEITDSHVIFRTKSSVGCINGKYIFGSDDYKSQKNNPRWTGCGMGRAENETWIKLLSIEVTSRNCVTLGVESRKLQDCRMVSTHFDIKMSLDAYQREFIQCKLDLANAKIYRDMYERKLQQIQKRFDRSTERVRLCSEKLEALMDE